MEDGSGREATGYALEAVKEAVRAISAGELGVDPILQRLAESARALVGARYAAIGVPDGEGGFAKFITSGMTEAQWDALGTLPRTHGLLGLMLETTAPYRAPNIQNDPRFEGWPAEHPNMRAFLGVPIVLYGDVIGAFYLTDKKGRRYAEFTKGDQQLIELLAAHAAIVLEHARLYEQSRELSTIEERKRLARELHDSVTQTLFSIGLTADAAAALVETHPGRAKAELERLRELARGAMEEMRAVVFELRPAELEADGLAPTLRKHIEVLRRIYQQRIELSVDGERRLSSDLEKGLFRIGQEALGNALRHAAAQKVAVTLAMRDSAVTLMVVDDGTGFDVEAARSRSRRLGLTSMQERTEALGGRLALDSGPGRGTTVSVVVELDGRDQGSRR